MVRQYVGAANFLKNFIKGGAQKTTGEAKDFVKVAKNLKKKRDLQDDVINTRERVMTEYGIKDPEKKVDVRKTANQAKINKKMSDILENKAKGGRVGLKLGTKKKSNIQKIKETFGNKKSLGMQSVIYGLDKNKNITAADPKAKFIAAANKKKKKKVI
tara:strand:- start:3 stop:476 length:474 start_codon:yes stop_codon:yes gene_type:complete